MANFGYQAKALISGVSTRPYALRDDGHMVDTSENCMLTPKFGLCKRPGSTYVQTIESNLAVDSAAFFPILTGGDSERVVFGAGNVWHVYGKDGTKYPVTFFPGSTNSATSAVSKYTSLGATYGPTTISTTSIGDVIFIADSAVTPRMKDATWDGYTETVDVGGGGTDYDITNDDAFAIWVRQVVMTTATFQRHTLAFDFVDEDGAAAGGDSADAETIHHTSTDSLGENKFVKPDCNYTSSCNRMRPHADWVAASFSYQISNFDAAHQCEATNLTTYTYGSPNADASLTSDEQINTVVGRLVKTDTRGINSISISGNSSGLETWGSVGWKSVPAIQDLPPNSWEDHTLKVGQTSDEAGEGGFYMRFVSDDETIEAYANNSGTRPGVTSTSKIPRKGHWEEHCGTGVKQEIDSSTMPLLFVTRPDNSYALMEARKSFIINEDTDGVTFVGGADDYFIVDNFDDGFNDDSTHSPLVVDDSIKFNIGGTNFPSQLSIDTTYYIKTALYTSGAWRYQLKTSKTSTTTISFDAGSAGDCEITLTTYDNFAWQQRVAGDDTTNPVPGFIDTGIQSIFNYQDRLGMITAGEVIFSGTGDYFNFFKTTVRDLDASDPFAAAPNLEIGDELRAAVPFDRDLMLLSTRAQFTLKAPEGLSPTTVAILNASRVETDTKGGSPTVVGDNIYVSSNQEEASTITALKSGDQSNTKVIDFDTSINTPGYLPLGPRKLIGNQKHNMLFYLEENNNTELYVYSWLDTKEGRPHSAWNKWTFGPDYAIMNLLVHGDRLYLLVVTSAMTVLEYIDLDLTTQDSLLNSTLKGNFDNCLIDHKTHNTVATEDESGTHGGVYRETLYGLTGDTLIKLKWKLTANNKANVVIVQSDGTIYEYDTAGTAADGTISVTLLQTGHTLEHGTTTSSTMTELSVNGVDLRNEDYYVGLKYTMNAVYGPFIPSMEQGRLSGRNIFAKSGRVTYSRANEFKISVDQDATYTQTVSAGSTTATKAGDTLFALRKHLPVMEFTLTNEKPWNAMFQVLKYDFVVQEIAGG